MKHGKLDCREMEPKLAELLLEPDSASAEVLDHVAECEPCRNEVAALQATMSMLDEWTVAEPNPYFMTRMEARLREEKQKDQGRSLAQWFARLRAGLLYGPEGHTRPLAAMALTGLLLVGGGSYLSTTGWEKPTAPSSQAAVVHDLQTMDNNAQLLDQLESLSATADDNDDSGDY